jgi:hypothetical protein
MKEPGVPVQTIRQMLTARYPNNPFGAALAILQNNERNGNHG